MYRRTSGRRKLSHAVVALLGALVLGLCATVYSLGWLVWAGMQFERLG